MEINFKVMRSGVCIYMIGELDEHQSVKARNKIDEIINRYSNTRSIVFNMEEVSFMDSTGIGMLIGRYKKLKQLKIPAYIENPSFCVDKVFLASGIYSLIPKL